MTNDAAYSQLILAPPAKNVEDKSIDAAYLEVRRSFQYYLGMWIDNTDTPLRDAMRSGLPYHLPFSLETWLAKMFAKELQDKGWRVVVVPSAWVE